MSAVGETEMKVYGFLKRMKILSSWQSIREDGLILEGNLILDI